MPAAVVLAFLLVPIAEIYVIVQVGQVIGAGWTILLLIADSIAGAWLVKREGRRAWVALQQSLAAGRMPGKELADGALVLVGGTLLLTPGFLTDGVGFFLLLPFTRPIARRVLVAFAQRWFGKAVVGPATGGPLGPMGFPPGGPRPYPPPPRGGRVVRSSVEKEGVEKEGVAKGGVEKDARTDGLADDEKPGR